MFVFLSCLGLIFVGVCLCFCIESRWHANNIPFSNNMQCSIQCVAICRCYLQLVRPTVPLPSRPGRPPQTATGPTVNGWHQQRWTFSRMADRLQWWGPLQLRLRSAFPYRNDILSSSDPVLRQLFPQHLRMLLHIWTHTVAAMLRARICFSFYFVVEDVPPPPLCSLWNCMSGAACRPLLRGC